MKKAIFIFSGLVSIAVLTAVPAGAQQDKAGCQDHPLFSRMQGYYLYYCEKNEFAAEDFIDPQTKQKVTIEGRRLYLDYNTKKEFVGKYSYVQVSRNYTNAITQIGGEFHVNDPKSPNKTSMRVVKDGLEIWAKIHVNTGADRFFLTVVERQAMTQEVVADAKTMAADIGASGKAVLYGIYFDVDKAEVKPESGPALAEIAQLLGQDPGLRLFVVGHTDSTGALDHNMKLSQQRAEAVVKELVAKHGVAADRLSPFGVGPLAPVTTNDIEEGRAKNRRVELVKQGGASK